MPASMISAPIGSMPKVIGSSMVMVAMGPTPGSTPISVPIRQPRKHSATFLSERATPRPRARLPTRSVTVDAPSTTDAALQGGECVRDFGLEADISAKDRIRYQSRGVEGDRQVEQLLE